MPVLKGDSLRFLVSIAIQKRCPLHQGNCKNTFCPGILPPKEVTIVRPPFGDPNVDPQQYWLIMRTLYGLQQCPCYWYNKIHSILQSIGLTLLLEDPCPYSSFIQDPSNPSGTKMAYPLSLVHYVDNFVYFSEDPVTKDLFCCLLVQQCKVAFMEIVNWFLGVHFFWQINLLWVTAHLTQSGFASKLVESFSLSDHYLPPMETPYRSSIPINSVAPSSEGNDSPTLKHQKATATNLPLVT